LESDSGFVDLTVSSFVNEITNSLEVWVSPCDVWFDDSDHVNGGLVDLDEDGIVNLSQSEKLEDLSDFWGNGVNTLDTDDDGEFGFWGNVEVSGLSGNSLQSDDITFGMSVFLDVLFGTFEDFFTRGFGGLLGNNSSGLTVGDDFVLGLSLLEQRLWNSLDAFFFQKRRKQGMVG